MLYYKEHPCGLAHQAPLPPMAPTKRALVELIANMNFEEMTETEGLRLISMLAAGLDLSIQEIKIRSVKRHDSILVRLEMPADAAQSLVNRFREKDEMLLAFFNECSEGAPSAYIESVRVIREPLISRIVSLISSVLPATLEGDRAVARTVVGTMSASAVLLLLCVPAFQYVDNQFRSRQLALDASRSALLIELSANEQLMGRLDRASRFAVLAARLESRFARQEAGPQTARMQLASLAARSRVRLRIEDDAGTIWLAGMSANGARLFTYSQDRKTRLWDTNTGEQVAKGERTEGRVVAVDFGLDGSQLSLVANDGSVKIWNADTGENRTVFAGSADQPVLAKVSPDGHLLAVGYLDGAVRVFDPASGSALFSLNLGAPILDGAFSPDGLMLAIVSRNRVGVFDIANGRLMASSPRVANCSVIAFRPDGGAIACAGDQAIELWNVREGGVSALDGDRGARTRSMSFSSDGARVMAVLYDDTVLVWNATTLEQAAILRSSSSAVVAAGFGRGGATVIAADADYSLQVWDGAVLRLSTPELVRRVCRQESPGSMRLTPEEMRLAGFAATVREIDVCTDADLRG